MDKKTVYTILIVAALAGLAIGGYYVMKKRGLRMQSASSESEETGETFETGNDTVKSVLSEVSSSILGKTPDEVALIYREKPYDEAYYAWLKTQ